MPTFLLFHGKKKSLKRIIWHFQPSLFPLARLAVFLPYIAEKRAQTIEPSGLSEQLQALLETLSPMRNKNRQQLSRHHSKDNKKAKTFSNSPDGGIA